MGAEGPTTGAAYTVGFLLVKAGGALIDNMAWLFAIGAAVGLADDHDGCLLYTSTLLIATNDANHL